MHHQAGALIVGQVVIAWLVPACLVVAVSGLASVTGRLRLWASLGRSWAFGGGSGRRGDVGLPGGFRDRS